MPGLSLNNDLTSITAQQTLPRQAVTPAPTAPAPAPVAPAGPANTPAAAPPGIVGPAGSNPVHVRLLAINDFHGQLGDSDAKVGADAIGGAATLAGYINRERGANPEGTVVLSVGDAFGASPPESSLLNHESSMAVLAGMGVNLATFGNHEWDRGYAEAMHLIAGGRRKKKNRKGKLVAAGNPWPGSPFPWVSANIIDKKTRKPIVPPYVIMEVKGVKVAFIGGVTSDLKNVTMAAGIKNLEALDPADAINKYIPEIKAKGVKAIVAFIHEGGDVDKKTGEVMGEIVDIAKRLDPEVDVVLSAHSHKEYSTRIAGKIVTQGSSYGKALAEIDLAVDPATGQVVAGSSRIIRNAEKGITSDPMVAKMVGMFQAAVAPKTDRVISVLPGAISKEKSPAGETPMGTLIAEAQRYYAGADLGIMNPGGIRQPIGAGGPVTWGKLFGVQPFSNHVIKLEMTGAEVLATLEQMFPPGGKDPIMLQLAGMRVWFDMRKPEGKRITKVITDDGKPLNLKRRYTVAANSFIVGGGDGLTHLAKAKVLGDVGVDLDALVTYLKDGNPVPTKPIGRLNIVGGTLPDAAH